MANLGDRYQQNMFGRQAVPALAAPGAGHMTSNRAYDPHIQSKQNSRFAGRAASQDGMDPTQSGSYRADRPQSKARRHIQYADAGTGHHTGNDSYGTYGADPYSSRSGVPSGMQSGVRSDSRSAAGRQNAVRTPNMAKNNRMRADAAVSVGQVNGGAVADKPKSPKKPKPKLHIVSTASVHSIPLTSIIIACIATALLFYIVYNIVSLNEMTLRLAESQSQLTELIKTEKELSLKLEMKNDLLDIEQIATEEYGMVKSDQVVKKYINIEGEDKIEISSSKETEDLPESRGAEDTDGETTGPLSTLMSAFANQFESFMEAIH